MTKKKKTVKREFSLQVMSPEEALALLESKGIRYELCDTPVPVLANKVSCGKLRGTGDETIDGYYYLPKSAVGLHPLMEITAQGESMIEADILDGDLLVTELGAVPMDGDIVVAEVDQESTAKVFFTDDQNQRWLCPMNRRYKPILLTEEMEVRITGVVRRVVKQMPRRSYNECMAIISRMKNEKCQEGDVFQQLSKAVCEGSHLFWAASAWAVAYAVMRDCGGYEGSMTEFERTALNLPMPMTFKFDCTAGTIQRTISNHSYMRLHVDKWRENGASARELVLMGFLRKFLI